MQLKVKVKHSPEVTPVVHGHFLEDKYFDLWRDSETDEIVGAHIWNASEWFKMILKTAEEHSTIKKVVAK